MRPPSWTPAPSSVKSVHAEDGQLAHGGEGVAGPSHGDGPGHRHLGQRAPPEVEHLARRPRPSRWPARCSAWRRRRCSRRARRPGPRSRPSRPPRGRAGADGCAGRPGPGPTRQPRRVEHGGPDRRLDALGQRRRTASPATATSSRASPSGPTTEPPRITRVGSGHGGHLRRLPGSSPPSSRNRMAMRTATPLVTCWVTTVRGRSATSEAISTPRTIGPGWVTMASSPSRCTRRP